MPPAGPSPSPGCQGSTSRGVEHRIRGIAFPGEGKRGTALQRGPPPPPLIPACERLAALVCGKSCGRLAGNRLREAPGGGFLGQAATPGPGRVPLLARPIWPSLGGRLA